MLRIVENIRKSIIEKYCQSGFFCKLNRTQFLITPVIDPIVSPAERLTLPLIPPLPAPLPELLPAPLPELLPVALPELLPPVPLISTVPSSPSADPDPEPDPDHDPELDPLPPNWPPPETEPLP